MASMIIRHVYPRSVSQDRIPAFRHVVESTDLDHYFVFATSAQQSRDAAEGFFIEDVVARITA
ncbi:hypothetical protein [Streptomyces sp. NPDC001404]|uniref:hypothetical protein n=1 Tax=Streptomyces sp. NPDC001404 TaxID=3364571 RepID=UPI0036852495